MNESYSIKEAADMLGVKPATIYMYEKKGLLKKDADPHRLKSAMTFSKEQVDALYQKKQAIDDAGISVSEMSKKTGITSLRINEAIKELNLDIPKVPYSLMANQQRFSLQPEHQKQISDYLSRRKVTRAKRNHLYLPEQDVALYQAFRIAGEQLVRLTTNETKEIGFQLDSDTFVTFIHALKHFDIEPEYSIHRPRQQTHQAFSDLAVPYGKKAFYQVLDTLYNVCGVENFNAVTQQGVLSISVRNGVYQSVYSVATLKKIQQYLIAGQVEVKDGYWHFFSTKKILQIQLDADDYPLLKAAADDAHLTIKELLEQYIKEKLTEVKPRI